MSCWAGYSWMFIDRPAGVGPRGVDRQLSPPLYAPVPGRRPRWYRPDRFQGGSRADGMGDTGIAEAQYRDLYFYSLYRVLEAGLLVLILFGPISELVPAPAFPLLGKATAVAYVALAPVLLFWAMRRVALRWQVLAVT